MKLIEFDSNKIFCGLSFYNPIHKYNLRIDYRKSDISNRYTTLPLMLHTIIQADEHMSSNYLQETFQKIKKLLHEIIGLKELQLKSIDKSPKDKARLEFFGKTKVISKDIEYPEVPLDELIVKIPHNILKKL